MATAKLKRKPSRGRRRRAPNQLKIIQKTNQPFNGSPLSLQYLLQPKESIFLHFTKEELKKSADLGVSRRAETAGGHTSDTSDTRGAVRYT